MVRVTYQWPESIAKGQSHLLVGGQRHLPVVKVTYSDQSHLTEVRVTYSGQNHLTVIRVT